MDAALRSRVAEIRARLDSEPEVRTVTLETVEIRDDGEGKIIFEGLAAPFDKVSENLGGFVETIQRGAFRPVLNADPDVRFLWNHNDDHPMARTTVTSGVGTLDLREIPKGLRTYAELAPTTAAKDLRTLVQARVVTQMSFAFTMRDALGIGPGKDVWSEDADGLLLRTIIRFGGIADVSPVTYAAYPQTDANVRTIAGVDLRGADGELQADAVRQLAWRIHRDGLTVTGEERAAIDDALSHLDTVSPWIAQRALRAVSQEPELQGAILGKRATVVLEDVPDGDTTWFADAQQRRLDLRLRDL